jgi:peroxiredoxin Q/BCP
VETIKKFKQKENLPFILLSDEGFKVSTEYGVYKEKSMYGKKYMGIERSTFIIDKDGIIRKIMRKVKVPNHLKEVIEEIKKLG